MEGELRDGELHPGSLRSPAAAPAAGAIHQGHHWWKAGEGEKRTITVGYEPSRAILRYLEDMRDALTAAVAHAYALTRTGGLLPSPIALRRKVKPWFDTQYSGYARHHVNPVCRTAIAILRSYRKKHHGRLAMPQVRRLAMRIDSELFRATTSQDGAVTLRLTLKPFNYEHVTFTPSHRKWGEYSKGRVSEIMLTARKICITFTAGGDGGKPLGSRLQGSDLNLQSVDSTAFGGGKLEPPRTLPLHRIVQVQNDFSRRRRRIQLHVWNPVKRAAKLAETRGRQRNRVRDELHKLSTRIVRENPDTSFVFEDLKNIRRRGERRKQRAASRKLRTYLNRWPYRMFQSMVEYKSGCRTLYVCPRGTSSKCPVCGGELEHPAWAVSRCKTCGADYGRNRLASLAILLRGLRLCRYSFTVSAGASWQQMRREYLYAPGEPRLGEQAGPDAANAPNRNAENLHVFPRF